MGVWFCLIKVIARGGKGVYCPGVEGRGMRSYGYLSVDLVYMVGVLASLVFFICSIQHAEGSIHEYSNETFIPRLNSFFFHGGSEGLYASKLQDTPLLSEDKKLNGRSFIRFDSIIFRRPKESAIKQNEMRPSTGLIEAIIVDVKDREKIGGSYLNSYTICCTPYLANEGQCKVGEVIIHPEAEKDVGPRRFQVSFEGRNEETKLEQNVEINKTGMYYLYFMFCDPELKGTLISGSTVWRNPEGYLPGKMAPMMTFSGFMSLAYLILGLIWFIRFGQFWKDLMQLHYHITAVIGLGMCEMAFWYFEYANFNSTGRRPLGITLWAVTFSAVKKTVSRLLILVVSMGYGVVRPTLGGMSSRVLLLGAVYFVASEGLLLVEHLGNINDFYGKTRLFLVLPVALLDASFILWIFSSLSKTLEKLQMRRSITKLELYRKFTNTLTVSVLLSIAWIGYELYFNATDPLSELWQCAWIIPAFWSLLSFFLLVAVCYLWAPSTNPTGYTYGEEAAGEEMDEEGLPLTGGGGVKPGGEMAQKHVFGLVGEVAEEDKRE